MPSHSSTQKTASVVKEVGLKIRSLLFTKVLAETGKRATKKILLDEQFLFVHFRLRCAECEVHLLILLNCPFLTKACNSLGSLTPFATCAVALHGSELFSWWYYLLSTLMLRWSTVKL